MSAPMKIEGLEEIAAKALRAVIWKGDDWDGLTDEQHEWYRVDARAVISAVAPLIRAMALEEAADANAKLIAAVDQWVAQRQPLIASASTHKKHEAMEREARSVVAYVAAEWAFMLRDPNAAVAAIRALASNGDEPNG